VVKDSWGPCRFFSYESAGVPRAGLKIISALWPGGCVDSDGARSWFRKAGRRTRHSTSASLPNGKWIQEDFARWADQQTAGRDGIVFSQEQGVTCNFYRAGNGLHQRWLEIRRECRPARDRLSRIFNPKHRRLLQLEKQTFTPERTGHVIANSPMVKEEILRLTSYPEDRISVITNGVDLERFRSGDRVRGREVMDVADKDFLVLLVGRGAFRKGHGFARQLEQSMRGEIKLRIIDSPPACPMEDIYAAADVFYLPTLYDPFSNATLEAMAAGVPVITSPNNGVSSLINNEENGFIVDPSDVEKTQTIVRSLMDEESREKIREAAARRIEVEQLEEKVLTLIDLLRTTGNA
jgi:UDP-glucose:(heptosyl)LPS alpha-1,3-glucosyltransferase